MAGTALAVCRKLFLQPVTKNNVLNTYCKNSIFYILKQVYLFTHRYTSMWIWGCIFAEPVLTFYYSLAFPGREDFRRIVRSQVRSSEVGQLGLRFCHNRFVFGPTDHHRTHDLSAFTRKYHRNLRNVWPITHIPT